jgi:hypothetical protein
MREAPMIGDSSPPLNVLVAVEVLVMEPTERSPEVMLEKVEETERRIEAKKEVVVAEVPVAFPKERLEVAVREPTVREPMVVEDSVMMVPVAKEKETSGKTLAAVVLVAK